MALVSSVSEIEESMDVLESPYALEHRGKALRSLRRQIRDEQHPVSESVLVAIMVLCTLEYNLGNADAYMQHIAVLKEFAHSPEPAIGPSNIMFSDIVKLYCDAGVAIHSGVSSFERRAFAPTYASQSPLIAPEESFRDMPPGLAKLLHQVQLTDDTVAVVRRLCEMGLQKQCITLTSSQQQRLTERRKASRKYLNFLDSVPIMLAPNSPSILFEKALILTLSLFANYGFCTTRKRHFGLGRSFEVELANILLACSQDTGSKHDCLAWMWLILIDSWRVGGENGSLLLEGRDALRQFLQRFSNYRSWTATQQLTKEFLWTGNMERFWRQNWEHLSAEVT